MDTNNIQKRITDIRRSLHNDSSTSNMMVLSEELSDVLHTIANDKSGIPIIDYIMSEHATQYDDVIKAITDINNMHKFYYEYNSPKYDEEYTIGNVNDLLKRIDDFSNNLNIVKDIISNDDNLNNEFADLIHNMVNANIVNRDTLSNALRNYLHMKKRFLED